MKLSAYCRDRLPAYLITGAAWGLMVLFMVLFRLQMQAVILMNVILLCGAAAAELWGFLRKKAYYDKLERLLDELDQKYLLSEMLDEPGFLDGRILMQVIQESDRAMCERIAGYRRESREFREYIELWVHEIKLPVAGLELMCHNDGNTRYAEQLGRIDRYIENVLYYARSGDQSRDYLIAPVELRRVFTDIAIRHRTELQERDIRLHAEGLDVTVMTDAKWLGFILGQLMGNSIRYGATGISVTAQVQPDRTLLYFRDNGIGIPERDLPYIFEKSFTGENGRTHSGSTGMGLYIVRKLCDKLGHTVQAQSEPGVFTQICIAFGRNDLHDVR